MTIATNIQTPKKAILTQPSDAMTTKKLLGNYETEMPRQTARAVNNVIKQEEEVNQRSQAVNAKASQIEPLKAELENSIREYHAKTRAVERDFNRKMSISFEQGKQAGKEEIENQMSQLHNQTTGQSFLEVFQNAWARKLKKEKSHDYGMER